MRIKNIIPPMKLQSSQVLFSTSLTRARQPQ